MRSRWLSLSVALVCFGALPAVAQTCKPAIPDSDLVAPGKIQMAINPTLPPQQFIDEKGELQGLNVELMKEIAKRLCVPLEFIRMDFPPMVPALTAFSVFTSVLVALISNEAAYMAEIIRGGFLAIPPGQTDAAKALGLARWQILSKIQLPQAVRIILPAVGNSVNGLLKATSLASVISMEELMRRSDMIMQLKFDVLEVYAAAAIDYLALTTLWDQVQKRLERRFNRGELAKVTTAVEQAALPR